MKVLVMAGTRPEAIKIAPVVRELRKRDKISTVVCNTGQHREMILQAFQDFGITPDVHLDVMQPDQASVDAIKEAIDAVENGETLEGTTTE